MLPLTPRSFDSPHLLHNKSLLPGAPASSLIPPLQPSMFHTVEGHTGPSSTTAAHFLASFPATWKLPTPLHALDHVPSLLACSSFSMSLLYLANFSSFLKIQVKQHLLLMSFVDVTTELGGLPPASPCTLCFPITAFLILLLPNWSPIRVTQGLSYSSLHLNTLNNFN